MENLKLDEAQRYFDEDTGQKLSLWFGQHNFLVDKISVSLSGLPLLRNEIDDKIYFPDKTKQAIYYCVNKAKEQGNSEVRISPKKLENKRYKFAEQFNFLYSQVDYEYIPGLMRPWNSGTLTPVFFNIAVLNKYSQHPEYKINLFSETYGDIWYGDQWSISFGINKSKKVIMWLGDIDKLPDTEKHYLRSENIESDHDIQSEFYDAQIDAEWSQPSKQSALFHLRNDLYSKIQERLSFDIYKLEGEISSIISNLDRPIFWEDKHVAPVIESFNRIFAESLSNDALKKDMQSINSQTDTKSKGSLKLFELWLSERLKCNNSAKLMCPFYVLYDFRLIVCHLQSENTRKGKFQSINQRLDIDENNENYEIVFDKIIERLSSSYKEMTSLLSKLKT